MPAASILIKPTSANCNINCEYCFYKCLSSNREEYSKGFMSDKVLEELVIQAIDYAEGYLAFAFQGGEPTLAGIDFFQKVVEMQKKYNTKSLKIENTIQTNGITIDEEWAKFLGKNHFLVGLSLDGPKKIHDAYRKDIKGNGTFERVMKTVSLFEKYHVDYNVVSVVTDISAQKASYIYKFYKRNCFPFVQLIPCMDEESRNTQKNSDISVKQTGTKYAVESERYGRFLCEIFDLWYEDFCRGERMDIRIFSNLAQMAAGYPAEQCGMNGCCNCYFVVEGDGSVYPCDFYCMDKWKLGTVSDSFTDMLTSKKAKEFVSMSEPVAQKCQGCSHFSLCKGGCRRWRESAVDGQIGLNTLCRGYEIFFAYAEERIQKLGQYIQLYHS